MGLAQCKEQGGHTLQIEAEHCMKWSKVSRFLSRNPRHRGLDSHEIDVLSRRYGEKVWQSYLENDIPAAGRMFWVYGPGTAETTMIRVEPHLEDSKSAGYAKVRLSAKGIKAL